MVKKFFHYLKWIIWVLVLAAVLIFLVAFVVDSLKNGDFARFLLDLFLVPFISTLPLSILFALMPDRGTAAKKLDAEDLSAEVDSQERSSPLVISHSSCNHTWILEKVETCSEPTNYCSYGGPDSFDLYHYYCPICGDTCVENTRLGGT